MLDSFSSQVQPGFEVRPYRGLHAMAGVEHNAHCIKEVFVHLKVLFWLDCVELELFADVRVVSGRIILEIVD